MPGTAHPVPPGASKLLPSGNTGSMSPCFLTWYDPALGGVNSSGGVANPHASMTNGKPYDPHAFTCAAPPNYAFGTKILFVVGKKQAVCEVTDRGGAITGSHFDLSRQAAVTLGLIPSFGYTGSAGSANGAFRVVDQSVPTGTTTTAAGQAASDVANAVSNAANAVAAPFKDLAAVVGFIFSLQFLYIVAGSVLGLVALYMVFRGSIKLPKIP